MDIVDVIKKKHLLENAIKEQILEFEKETGLSVKDIGINKINFLEIGKGIVEYTENIKLTVNL